MTSHAVSGTDAVQSLPNREGLGGIRIAGSASRWRGTKA